jgi:signal transduction histidine kinase
VRRRLILVSLATTVLVVVSFVLPLGLLVRRQAIEGAKVAAERDAQSVAGLVALASALSSDAPSLAAAIGELPLGTIVLVDESTVLGSPTPGQGGLAAAARQSRSTVADDVEGGWELALPVVGGDSVTVVDTFVPETDLTAGVGTAWALLGGLALVLVGVAVWVADRLGRSLTTPIEDLARSAHRLAEGDLDTRVEPGETHELRETGEAFNYLAERLDDLLAEERESAADLSHRLRTPLTSLRLQAEALGDEGERQTMLAQVDRLEHAMNQVIELSRSRAARPPGSVDLNQVVADRAGFWRVLAEEQGRELTLDLADGAGLVPLARDDVEVLVDTLVGNVFSHTPAPTPFEVRTGAGPDGVAWLEVSDRGPGFADPSLIQRGVSGGGSTGLGLDIVAKTASSAGGSVQVSDRPGGGAVVRVLFG